MKVKILLLLSLILFAGFFCPPKPNCKTDPVGVSVLTDYRIYTAIKDSVFSVDVYLTSVRLDCFYGNFKIKIDNKVYLDTFIANTQQHVEYKFNYRIPDNIPEGDTLEIVFWAHNPNSGFSRGDSCAILVIVREYHPPILTFENQEVDFFSPDYEDCNMMARFDTSGITFGNKNLDGDLTYFYNALHYGNCLLSPNNSFLDIYGYYTGQSYDYQNKRQTIIIPANYINYESVDMAYLDTMQINVFEAPQIDSFGYGCAYLKQNQVYKFLLSDGRKGILKINYLSNPNPKTFATLNFDVKYQKYPQQAK